MRGGRSPIRPVVAALVVLVALGVLESSARAAASPIAEVTAGTPLSGGQGWLLWSAPVAGGGWILMGYHDGTVAQLDVARRSQPFDASVGTDAAGAPVAVFSRCAHSPEVDPVTGESPGGELVAALGGRGCRIHELSLDRAVERPLPIPTSPRASDTTPAIWRGVVTFARRSPAHRGVMQVLSWAPHSPRTLKRLPHGAIPVQCRKEGPRCRRRPVQGVVSALAADGSVVAFVWSVSGGNVGIDGERELRVDRADSRGSALADGEVGHEACTFAGAGEHVLEAVDFEPPFVSGSTAFFGELYDFGCFTGFASVLMSHDAAPGYSSRGKLEAVSLATASVDGRLYGLVPSAAEDWTIGDGPSCKPAWPCTIEALDSPAMMRDSRPPYAPAGQG